MLWPLRLLEGQKRGSKGFKVDFELRTLYFLLVFLKIAYGNWKRIDLVMDGHDVPRWPTPRLKRGSTIVLRIEDYLFQDGFFAIFSRRSFLDFFANFS